jgi:3-hydroxyisobutyrate dehydrogenase-like beta-hydroxyacid dehydrogenase
MSGSIGFIGLGVMGEPMCRNLATKGRWPVTAFDLNAAPMERLATHGVQRGTSAATVLRGADTVLLSLPGGKELQALCDGPAGLVALAEPGQTIVDLSTCPVGLTREIAGKFAAKGVAYADAPVARTRQAAEDGTLAITVGASKDLFDRIEPILRCFASEVTHCGEVGAGQVVKIMNNMVVLETVNAIAEAAAISEKAGVQTALLYGALSKGSADSFVLRNHGMKAIVPSIYPERAFSAEYMIKDVSYALELAEQAGVDARGARLGLERLKEAVAAGHGAAYWPVIAKVI